MPIRCAFLSQNPYIGLFHNVLSPDECNYLIEYGSPHLVPSEVVAGAGDKLSIAHEGRTSTGCCIKRGETLQVEAIERRIAALTNSPYENGEGLQITRYEAGQFYQPHHDYFDPGCAGYDRHLARGGQRVFSVILYLNDGFRGGETEFPVLRFMIPPIKGSALVFANLDLQTDRLDDSTLHGGRAPIGGTKFIATKWIRQNQF